MKYYGWLIFLILLIFNTPSIGFGDTKQSAVQEAEDREFIRNLFADKFYDHAATEVKLYLQHYKKGAFRDEVVFISAQISVNQKKYSAALKNYDRVLKEFPSSRYTEETLFLAGSLNIQLGEREKGAVYIKRLLKEFPKTKFKAETHYPMGLAAYQGKRWKQAQHEFQQALKSKKLVSSHRLEAEYLLGWCYHFQKLEKQAEASFTHLLTLPLKRENKTKISFQLATYAQNRKQYVRANHWYQRQMDEWPSPEFQSRSRFQIAENIFRLTQTKKSKPDKKEVSKAIRYLTKNINAKKPVKLVISRYYRGWLYQQKGMKKEAELDFYWLQQTHKSYARDFGLSLVRAQNFEERGKYRQAVNIYTVALPLIKAKKIREDLIIRVARLYLDRLHDRKNAKKWFTMLHLKGNRDLHRQASTILAEMKIEEGNYPGATKILHSLTKMKIKGTRWYAKTYLRLAELYQTQKKWDVAIQYYQKVLSSLRGANKKSTLQLVHYRLGELYQTREKWSLALTHYKRAANLSYDPKLRVAARVNSKKIEDYLKH